MSTSQNNCSISKGLRPKTSLNNKQNANTTSTKLVFTKTKKGKAFEMSCHQNKSTNHKFIDFSGLTASRRERNKYSKNSFQSLDFLNLQKKNKQLSEIVKIQQSKLNYLKEQQKRKLNSLPEDNVKTLRKKIFFLQENLCKVSKQLQETKKTLKLTRIKELQAQSQESSIHICSLVHQNGQLKKFIKRISSKGLQKGLDNSTMINLANQYIQKQCTTKQELFRQLAAAEKSKQNIQHNQRQIRKLKVSLRQKSLQLEQLSRRYCELKQIEEKKRIINQQYVKRSDFNKKLAENIELVKKLDVCQKKIAQQSEIIYQLKKSEIDTINKQVQKRKILMSQLQELKQKYRNLQSLLTRSSATKTIIPDINFSISNRNRSFFRTNQTFNNESIKIKYPKIVSLVNVCQIKDKLVHNLQEKKISLEKALQMLTLDRQEMTLRQVAYLLENQDFGLNKVNQRQLLARYVVEEGSLEEQQEEYINFQLTQSVQVIRSILKKLMTDYCIFDQQKDQKTVLLCKQKAKQYFNNWTPFLLEKLSKQTTNINKNKSGEFQITLIIQTIQSDRNIDLKTLEYIKFKTFTQKNQNHSMQQFIDLVLRTQADSKQQQKAQILNQQSIFKSQLSIAKSQHIKQYDKQSIKGDELVD